MDEQVLDLAKRYMKETGLYKTDHLKSLATDLFLWKRKENPYTIQAGTGKVTTWRCPLSFRAGCKCLLRLTEFEDHAYMDIRDEHSLETHSRGNDRSKFLKVADLQVISEAVQLDTMVSAKRLRHNLHRTSPEKRIPAQQHRFPFLWFKLYWYGPVTCILFFIRHVQRAVRHF